MLSSRRRNMNSAATSVKAKLSQTLQPMMAQPRLVRKFSSRILRNPTTICLIQLSVRAIHCSLGKIWKMSI